MTRQRVTSTATILALVAIAGCGPSLVGDDDGHASDVDTSASSGSSASASASATADDGPGTSATTSPGTTANPTMPMTMGDTADPDDGDDEAVDTEGCLFLDSCGFDVGLNIECDVWAQDCPAGEKCMPWANDGGSRWNATRCSPLDRMPALVGEPCGVEGSGLSGIDNCEISAMCWDVDPTTNQGTCVAMCSGFEGNPACADDSGTECMMQYDGVVNICLPPCDPLLQDCSAIAECLPSDDIFFCVPDQSGKSGQVGTGCVAFDGCDPGLFCANAELVPNCADVGCCAEFCDLSLDPLTACATDDGVQCLPWYDEGTAPAGYELLGACVLPS